MKEPKKICWNEVRDVRQRMYTMLTIHLLGLPQTLVIFYLRYALTI